MYLVWYDDDRRKSNAQKIDAAIAAYIRHFMRRPGIVLVHTDDPAEHHNIRVHHAPFVRRDHYWVGQDTPPITGGMAATRDIDSAQSVVHGS